MLLWQWVSEFVLQHSYRALGSTDINSSIQWLMQLICLFFLWASCLSMKTRKNLTKLVSHCLHLKEIDLTLLPLSSAKCEVFATGVSTRSHSQRFSHPVSWWSSEGRLRWVLANHCQGCMCRHLQSFMYIQLSQQTVPVLRSSYQDSKLNCGSSKECTTWAWCNFVDVVLSQDVLAENWMTVKWVDEERLLVSVFLVSKAVVPQPSDIVPGIVGKVRFSGS